MHHTAGQECLDAEDCVIRVREIQTDQMRRMNFSDITYNFLVGGDGRVYEGCGWDRAASLRSLGPEFQDALSMALVGTYTQACPHFAQLDALAKAVGFFAEQGKLTADYRLVGACQLINTASPGLCFMEELATWDHWWRVSRAPEEPCPVSPWTP
ncbi:peptidoglycan-recognition protein 2-like [Thrips palmi]|uniref:Peptidoglycan-recognition protein 2-like n=1 Tax=Thrips palmi TaxID=161013 RepID=A0A6P9AF36_THRPL|nr:peptidoglycan-recognition protein 2-like [Thrips palmi]